MYDLTSVTETQKDKMLSNMAFGSGLDHGVILDAGRELRVKLYMGQVFMGWFWFIPTFHMPQPPLSSSSDSPSSNKVKFVLTRKDLDFALGIGSSIIDVEAEMEWVIPPSSISSSPATTTKLESVTAALSTFEPPLRSRTGDSQAGTEQEPAQSTLATALQVVLDGAGKGEVASEEIREAIEAKQGDAV